MATNWFSVTSEEVQPWILSASKNRLKNSRNNTLHINIGDLLTSAQPIVVGNLAIEVLLDTATIDEHKLAIVPDKQKLTVRKSLPVAIVTYHDVSANSVFTKERTQARDEKFHFDAMDAQRSTIEKLEHILCLWGEVA